MPSEVFDVFIFYAELLCHLNKLGANNALELFICSTISELSSKWYSVVFVAIAQAME